MVGRGPKWDDSDRRVGPGVSRVGLARIVGAVRTGEARPVRKGIGENRPGTSGRPGVGRERIVGGPGLMVAWEVGFGMG
jgi:hypothetical protein